MPQVSATIDKFLTEDTTLSQAGRRSIAALVGSPQVHTLRSSNQNAAQAYISLLVEDSNAQEVHTPDSVVHIDAIFYSASAYMDWTLSIMPTFQGLPCVLVPQVIDLSTQGDTQIGWPVWKLRITVENAFSDTEPTIVTVDAIQVQMHAESSTYTYWLGDDTRYWNAVPTDSLVVGRSTQLGELTITMMFEEPTTTVDALWFSRSTDFDLWWTLSIITPTVVTTP